MVEKRKDIVKVDTEELIERLNKALADEWLAYYQYWVGSKIAVGKMRGPVEAELREHAEEELEHAEMLADRITQLGGTPILKPEAFYEKSNCGYEVPENPKVEKLLEQNIKGEQCAIAVYQNLLEFVEGKDPLTKKIVVEILEDEVEHEEDLQAIQEDMEQ